MQVSPESQQRHVTVPGCVFLFAVRKDVSSRSRNVFSDCRTRLFHVDPARRMRNSVVRLLYALLTDGYRPLHNTDCSRGQVDYLSVCQSLDNFCTDNWNSDFRV